MKNISREESCPDCGRYANRGIAIDAVIIRDNKILLNKRGAEPDKGKWALPGGYVEWDESVPDAVAREVAEETGLKVVHMQLIDVYSDPARHPKQAISIAYLVEAIGDPEAGDDAEESHFVSLDALPSVLAFDHVRIISSALLLSTSN